MLLNIFSFYSFQEIKKMFVRVFSDSWEWDVENPTIFDWNKLFSSTKKSMGIVAGEILKNRATTIQVSTVWGAFNLLWPFYRSSQLWFSIRDCFLAVETGLNCTSLLWFTNKPFGECLFLFFAFWILQALWTITGKRFFGKRNSLEMLKSHPSHRKIIFF